MRLVITVYAPNKIMVISWLTGAGKKIFYRARYVAYLLFSQLRINGQGKDFARCFFAFRKITLLMAQWPEALLLMEAQGVINIRADAVIPQELHESIAPGGNADNVLIEDGCVVGADYRGCHFSAIAEQLIIEGSVAAPLF